MKQQDKVFMIVGSTAVLVATGITGIWLFSKTDTSTTSTTLATAVAAEDSTATISTSKSSAVGEVTSSTSSGAYVDGTYKATTNYMVPHGTNDLTASVTISAGKVTAVSVNHDYADQESGMYIDSFESALQSAVIGQSIDGLSLSRIGGASLTTQAFDDALATIRTDAKA